MVEKVSDWFAAGCEVLMWSLTRPEKEAHKSERGQRHKEKG